MSLFYKAGFRLIRYFSLKFHGEPKTIWESIFLTEQATFMNRQAINPANDWASNFHYNQGEVIDGINRMFYMSGQISAESDPTVPPGVSVKFKGDQRKQMIHALEKIDHMLEKAKMSRRNLIQIRFYTVDVQDFLENYDVYTNWIQEAEIRPTNSLIGVKELALADVMVEIEAVAAE